MKLDEDTKNELLQRSVWPILSMLVFAVTFTLLFSFPFRSLSPPWGDVFLTITGIAFYSSIIVGLLSLIILVVRLNKLSK